MRILLDESVPERLGPLLAGHTWETVRQRGWKGLDNGKLLAVAAADFDVLLTADRNMEYQQNLTRLPIAVLVVLARSNRVEDLTRAIPAVLDELRQLPPRAFRKVTAW
jgi:predicted nuclease of predicted toxin-antitoxin system